LEQQRRSHGNGKADGIERILGWDGNIHQMMEYVPLLTIEEGEYSTLGRTETNGPILAISFLVRYLKQSFHRGDLAPGDAALDANQVQRRPRSAVALVREQSPRTTGPIAPPPLPAPAPPTPKAAAS